jgi:hypothetical protein
MSGTLKALVLPALLIAVSMYPTLGWTLTCQERHPYMNATPVEGPCPWNCVCLHPGGLVLWYQTGEYCNSDTETCEWGTQCLFTPLVIDNYIDCVGCNAGAAPCRFIADEPYLYFCNLCPGG